MNSVTGKEQEQAREKSETHGKGLYTKSIYPSILEVCRGFLPGSRSEFGEAIVSPVTYSFPTP